MAFYQNLVEKGKVSKEDREPYIDPFWFYIESFFELRNDATMNGTIPWTTLHAFANIKGISDFELFRYCIRCIEKAFMEDRNAKNSNNRKKS